MVLSSSGLLPAKKGKAREKKVVGKKLEFQMCIKPAPMCIKPLASLVNPFRSGCSIYCNHPTSNLGLKMAIEKTKRRKLDEEQEAEMIGEILEDILCRRGQRSLEQESLDSSPSPLPPVRPHLVLNLRRTASQDTGRTSAGFQSTFSPSPSSLTGPGMKQDLPPALRLETLIDSKSEAEEEDGDVVRRRGKVRKKKRKGAQPPDKGEKAVVELAEPHDTLVSTFDGEGGEAYESEEQAGEGGLRGVPKDRSAQPSPPPLHSDVFDRRTLRHLRRSLSTTQVKAEFRNIWRRVLEEALSASNVLPEEEVKVIDDIPPPQPETWISYPRLFSRSAVRFDLPINKALLKEMDPLKYLKDYVAISKGNMLLYDYVYKQYKDDNGNMTSEALLSALGEVMGREFTGEEREEYTELINLQDRSVDYRTWLGVAAVAERYYGEKFRTGKDMDLGKRQVIERVDFESLERRLDRLQLNPKIARLLEVIKTS